MEDCRPDEYPPYEPVPSPKITVLIGTPLSKDESQLIGKLIGWLALGLLGANIGVQLGRWLVG